MESLEGFYEEQLPAQNLGVDFRYVGVIEKDTIGVRGRNLAADLVR